MTKVFLEITADENDGDYINERNEIEVSKLDKLRIGIKALKEKGGNFPVLDCASPEVNLLSLYGTDAEKERNVDYYESGLRTDKGSVLESLLDLYEYVPYDEYGIHTIVSINIVEYKITEELL